MERKINRLFGYSDAPGGRYELLRGGGRSEGVDGSVEEE